MRELYKESHPAEAARTAEASPRCHPWRSAATLRPPGSGVRTQLGSAAPPKRHAQDPCHTAAVADGGVTAAQSLRNGRQRAAGLRSHCPTGVSATGLLALSLSWGERWGEKGRGVKAWREVFLF